MDLQVLHVPANQASLRSCGIRCFQDLSRSSCSRASNHRHHRGGGISCVSNSCVWSNNLHGGGVLGLAEAFYLEFGGLCKHRTGSNVVVLRTIKPEL